MSYKSDKINNDKDVAYYFLQRMCEDMLESDAYIHDVIDGIGTIDSTNEDKKWSFTLLDSIIHTLKIEIGEDRTKELFKGYSKLRYFEPNFIKDKGYSFDYVYSLKGYEKIVSIFNSLVYLPNNIDRNDSYIDGKVLNKESIRESLTFFMYLVINLTSTDLSGVMLDRLVMDSTEETFGALPHYLDLIKSIAKDKSFIVDGSVTPAGIQYINKVCKVIIDHNLYLSGDSKNNYRMYIDKIGEYGE